MFHFPVLRARPCNLGPGFEADLPHPDAHAFEQRAGLLGIRFGQQQDELISAVPGQDIEASLFLPHAFGQIAESPRRLWRAPARR